MPTRRIYTVEGAQRAIAKLPRELQKELRAASQDIASDIATHAAVQARYLGGVAKYVAPTIKARKDRYPVVVMGGNRRSLPSGGVIGDVWAGAEFGSRRYRQFAPWEPGGRFLFRTVSERGDEIMDRWTDALQTALDAI